MTPSASSRWIRFQHGVEDKPTRAPISATESDALSCKTARIFLSIASMSRFFLADGAHGFKREKYSKARGGRLTVQPTCCGDEGDTASAPGCGPTVPFCAKTASTSARLGAPAEPPIRVHFIPATAEPKRM